MKNNENIHEEDELHEEIQVDEEIGERVSINEEEEQEILEEDEDDESAHQEGNTGARDADEASIPVSNMYTMVKSAEGEVARRNQEMVNECDAATNMQISTEQRTTLSEVNERTELDCQPLTSAAATLTPRSEKFPEIREEGTNETTRDYDAPLQDSSEGSFASRPGAYAIHGRASGERPRWEHQACGSLSSTPSSSTFEQSNMRSSEIEEEKEEETEESILEDPPQTDLDTGINHPTAQNEINSTSEDYTAGESFNDEPIEAVIVTEERHLSIQLNKMLEENRTLTARLQRAEQKVHAWENYKPTYKLKMTRWYLVVMLLVLITVTTVLGIILSQRKQVLEEDTDNENYGSLWISLGDKLLAETEMGNAQFGEYVDLSALGDYLAIGASATNEYTGQIEVRQYSGSTWRRVGNPISGTQVYENFGRTVQISKSGDFLVASGYGTEMVKGVIRAYKLNKEEQEWDMVGDTIYGDYLGDKFGFSLSASDTGLSWIVGAVNARNDDYKNGYAKIYTLVGYEWQQKGSTIFGTNNELCGYAVAMSGDGGTVCVGDRWYKVPDVGQRGRARCFAWKKTNEGYSDWIQKGSDIIGNYEDGEMGYSLSLNYAGDRVAVGDRNGGDNKQGSVSVFQFSENEWNIMGSEQSSAKQWDHGGSKVSLNTVGDVLAWTLPGYNADGNDTGIVRIVRWVDNTWKRLGNDLLGDEAHNKFGESIALDDEGRVIAASANSGDVEYVRTFQLMP